MFAPQDLTAIYQDSDILTMEAAIGYTFNEKVFLVNALTRRSYWHENQGLCNEHNERLEFLGDAVLGLIVAELLYIEFPNNEEGDLQKKRAGLVNRTALAQNMRNLGLSHFIRMGRGDELSGCRDRDSVLADTFEAILAAVYLDGSFKSARKVIEKHFLPLIKRSSFWDELKDCKSHLQEKAQADLGVTPTYQVIDQSGEDHCKVFSVAVYLGEQVFGLGTGKNKREAAQNAAREALEKLL
jgi:ribonuclease III